MIYTFITQLSIENGDQMLSLNIFYRKLGGKKRGITKFLLNFLPKLLVAWHHLNQKFDL